MSIKVTYSRLSKFQYSPKLYSKRYIENQTDIEDTKAMIEGKLTHLLLLEPQNFNDNYILLPKLPTDKAKFIIDKLYFNHNTSNNKLSDYSQELLELMQTFDFYNNIKDVTLKLKKIINDETLGYWEFLQESSTKTVIDTEMLNRCYEAVEAVKNNELAMSILNTDLSEKSFSEIKLEKECDGYYLQGIIDRLIHDEFNTRIVDIKRISRVLDEFDIESMNYDIQAVIYKELVHDKPGIKSFYFIVIDKYNSVGVFKISDKTIDKSYSKYNNLLEEFLKHHNLNYFDSKLKYLDIVEI